MMRHTRVSCSRTVASTRFIGIALAKVNTSASNSIVNPDPGRAHPTSTSRTPCSGQRTRGTRACRNTRLDGHGSNDRPMFLTGSSRCSGSVGDSSNSACAR